ncbi:probable WRKY transcription factor 13 [Phoenix dactylifera]|uniref:Probable WRKY transcription factor 13 n=1 Tax=Phoenix dactylifera TaxID=42345 RepID=A0A8B7CAA1_PHODC|nr:probable WRKY transcription factor 13 [Phoenix dactylifera]
MFPPKVSAVLNQGFVEDRMSFCTQISPPPHLSFPPHGIQQTLGGLNMGGGVASYLKEGLPSIPSQYGVASSDGGGLGQFGASSGQRSSNSLWSYDEEEGDLGNKISSAGEDDHKYLKNNSCSSNKNNINNLSVGAIRMKKLKARKKVREPRFCFKTLSEVDVLDDGYKWRKYGQKIVKNTQHPRSYYRCTESNCQVKKRVERLAEDPRMVITTYEGRHLHSPSRDEDELRASDHISFLW